jgi:hypothetical protein
MPLFRELGKLLMTDTVYMYSALESVTTLFWLITFAVLASEASGMSTTYYPVLFGDITAYLPGDFVRAVNCSKASAGLGALEWLLFVLTLVCVGMLLPPTFFSFYSPLICVIGEPTFIRILRHSLQISP